MADDVILGASCRCSCFGREETPENIHRLVRAAAVQHRPIVALYDGTRRLMCPHVLGYNLPGQWRVFCYQCGGESRSGPRPNGRGGNWRCLWLKKLSSVESLDGPWQTGPPARQRCVESIEAGAEDHADHDPQNGQ